MSYSHIIRPEAEADIREAFLWYEERGTKLGNEFLRAVDATMNSIGRNPALYPEIYRDVRRAIIRRFPFSIHFMFENQQIIILSCLHDRRNPQLWQGRAT